MIDWRGKAGAVFETGKAPAAGSGGIGMIMFGAGKLTGASCWRADATPVAIGGMARRGLKFEG